MGRRSEGKKYAGKKSREHERNQFSDFVKTNDEEIGKFSSSSSDSEENPETEKDWQSGKNKKFKSFDKSICQFRQLSTIDDELSSSTESLKVSDVEIDETFDDTQPLSKAKNFTIKEDTSESDNELGIAEENAMPDNANLIEKQSICATQDTIDDLTPSPSITANKSPLQCKEEDSQTIEIDEQKEEEDEEELNESVIHPKKKLMKGGLAERLQIVQRRQRSDFVFWKHKKNEHNLKGVIQAPIIDIKPAYGVVSVTCSLKDDREFLLLLSNDVFKNLGATVGIILIIHPPWFSLYVKELQSLVLLNVIKINTLPMHSECSWTSACQELFDLYEKYSITESSTTEGFEEEATLKEIHSCNPTMDIDNAEKKISTRQDVMEKPFSKELTIIGRVQRVFVERISSSVQCMPFVVSLHNKYNEAETVSVKLRVCMLLHDADNQLIMIQKTTECEGNEMIAYFSKTEGKIVEVNHLVFMKKISNRKNSSLKSIMQLFVECEESQVLSQEASGSSGSLHSNQMFVYNFNENADIEESLKIVSSNDFVFPYVTSKAVCESEERRLSIDLRLLAIVDENSPSNLNSNTNNHSKTENSLSDICKMFAISLAGDLVTVQVHHSFFLPMELKKMFFAEDVNFIPLHLKDALVNGKDSYIADGYSRIFLLSSTQNDNLSTTMFTRNSCSLVLLENLEFPYRMSTLQQKSQEGELIKLTGRICGIDEKTALFWKVCNVCGSNDLENSSSSSNPSFSYCEECKKNVPFQIRVQLDVFLHKSTLPNINILCKLADESITELLPLQDIKNEVFTGFDFRSILGKKLSSKLFYVTSVTNNYGRNRTKLFNLKECRPLSCF